MLCDHLEGWYREGWEGDAKGRGYGDICIHIADSLCYTAETNNIVKQLYSNKDVLKKKKLLKKNKHHNKTQNLKKKVLYCSFFTSTKFAY